MNGGGMSDQVIPAEDCHDWQENCPPETNHKPNCRCGYFCTVCGAIDR